MSEVIISPGRCVIWRCGKPLRGENGEPHGARGMCWQHLKQAQREGGLAPYQRPTQAAFPCQECGERPRYRTQRCRPCYDRHYRRTSPRRQELLAADRARKAAARKVAA